MVDLVVLLPVALLTVSILAPVCMTVLVLVVFCVMANAPVPCRQSPLTVLSLAISPKRLPSTTSCSVNRAVPTSVAVR